jgi:hypothetical protein
MNCLDGLVIIMILCRLSVSKKFITDHTKGKKNSLSMDGGHPPRSRTAQVQNHPPASPTISDPIFGLISFTVDF